VATARNRTDALVLFGLVVLALAVRFVDLPTRGTWESDQGHDLLVLRALVVDGAVPLLGPPTSIGDIHHGALYYYLLAPAAFVLGAEPVAIVGWIALLGVGAVAATWWLGRMVGGPLVGAIAGLILAVSATSIEASTFVWNPNPIGLASAVAYAAAWRARATGRAGWWLVAAVGTAVTLQLHVLGAVMAPALAAFFLADWRAAGGPERRQLARVGLASVAIVALSFAPLVVHELGHDFGETRNAIAYLIGGRDGGGPGLPSLVVIALLRVVAWPLTGLVTDAPAAAILAVVALAVVAAWRAWVGDPAERRAVRWLGLTLAWSVVALAVLAPDLAAVIPGLPNDHYHAFADPAVAVLAALGIAGLARGRATGEAGVAAAEGVAAAAADRGLAATASPSRLAGPIIAGLVLVAIVGWNVSRWPPAVSPDGGWPAAEAAAKRIEDELGGRPFALVGLPTFKPTDAYGFPLARRGLESTAPGDAEVLVVACDRLFEATYGAACGGAAEAAGGLTAGFREVIVFEASPRTVVSLHERVRP
jgi:hypothetical protein